MSDDPTRRGFLGTVALAAAETTLPDVAAQPAKMLGTGGRPNLMVIEDYNAPPIGTRSDPAYRFELHMSIALKSATVANNLRASLAKGKVSEIEKHLIDDGGGDIVLNPANILKLRKLLQAIFQAS